MSKSVSVVIFEGSQPMSHVEEMMVSVRQAALLDNLDKMVKVSALENIFLHTNRLELVEPASKRGVEVSLNSTRPQDFHIGRELQSIVRRNSLTRVICLNGASCPLITVDDLNMICSKLMDREQFVYANNIQSADIIAFTVPKNFDQAKLPSYDNSLAMTLRDQLGLTMELMPQSLGLLFDIDTPTDVLVLGSGPYAGKETRAVIDSLNLNFENLNRAKTILQDEYQDVALLGRVGAPIIERMNSVLKLRLRVFSEERGMKSLGRIESKKVVSLLGLLLEHINLKQFFSYLSQVANCVFIDSRVLMYHYKYDIADQERFLSDLGIWQQIEHAWLREFTMHAVECGVPVILGGHSLVSGSLWALTCELKQG